MFFFQSQKIYFTRNKIQTIAFHEKSVILASFRSNYCCFFFTKQGNRKYLYNFFFNQEKYTSKKDKYSFSFPKYEA